mgnify:CR=1 FL=1|tara:strand:- start:450 stop:692 length:243 start_codon:yes stop_codon:yes gene_type:complete
MRRWWSLFKSDEFHRLQDIQEIRGIVKDYFEGTKVRVDNVRVYPIEKVVIIKTNMYMEDEPQLEYLLRDKTSIKWELRWE